VIERHVKASPETVFKFFTDPRRWLQWQGVDAELEPDGDGTPVRLTHRNLPGAAFAAHQAFYGSCQAARIRSMSGRTRARASPRGTPAISSSS
jgi:hypothetical protein